VRRHGRITAAIRFAESTVLLAVSLTPAHADSAFALNIFNEDIPPGQLILMVALLAAVAFALVSAIFLIRMRNRLEVENRRLKVEVGGLKARVERADALLDEEDQLIIAWSSPNDEPLVAGALPAAAGVPAEPAAPPFEALATGGIRASEGSCAGAGVLTGVSPGTATTSASGAVPPPPPELEGGWLCTPFAPA
jgi:hypothetical protein